ncbi:MAG: retention module-containing protein, partial [Candidatus Thiodiazotropha sp.]
MATQATQTTGQVIGFVRQVIGDVKATGSDGVTRTLQVGDLVFADDLVVTGELGSIEIVFNDGGDLTLGRNSQGLLDADVYETETPEDGSEYAASIDAIQQAILLGGDPTAIQEAPAAGEGESAVGNEGANFVTVERTGAQTTPESGFETEGLTISFADSDESASLIDLLPTIDLDGDDNSQTGSGYLSQFTENGGPLPIADADIQVSNPDGTLLESARIVLTNAQLGDQLDVSAVSSLSVDVDTSVPGVITVVLSGSATPQVYAEAIRGIGFINDSDNPDETPRTIEVTVNDGESDSNTAVTTITVQAVNDAPVVDLDNDDSSESGYDYLTTFTEGDEAISIVDIDASVSDVDNASLQSATITLTNPQSDDVLAFTEMPAGLSAMVDGYTITISGDGTLDDYQSAIRAITFENTSENPSAETRVVEVTVNDGELDSNIAVTHIEVVGVNDVAVLDLDADDSSSSGTGYETTYIENQSPVAIVDDDVVIDDVDDEHIESATVELTNPTASDLLVLGVMPTGISATVDGATVTLTGTASLADYQQALQAVYFSNTSEDPFTDDRTINITLNDGDGNSETAVTTVHVISVNDGPDAVNDSVTTQEDVPVRISVLRNDSDPEGDPLLVTSLTQPSNGTLTTLSNGTYQYIPDAGFTGSDSFRYTISDGNGASDSAIVRISVAGGNDGPVAVSDNASTDENTPVTIDVLTNDSDPEGDVLSISSFSQGANGTVAIDPVSGNPVYTPNPGFTGTDSFSYTVSDGNGGADTATVTVTVADAVGDINAVPVAADDSVVTDEDLPVTVNVRSNDSDPDGDVLTVTSVTQGANGSVTIDPVSGNPVYTPNPDFNGTDTFTYTVDDGNGGTDTATVTVNVGVVNDAPVAADDSIGTSEDTPVTVDVLPNDSDPDGDTLSIASFTQGANGSVAIDPVSGNPVYTPNPDFNGTDTFTYTVDDGNGGTDTATVTVTVGAVNDAPVAADDSIGTSEDTPVTIDVLPNDSDPDGDTLSIASFTQGANGTVSIDPVSGNPVYSPNPDFNGTDTFTYTVDDGNGGTDTATVTVTVGIVNDAPVAADDSIGTSEDTPVTIDVLPNDSDPDGDTLSIASFTQGTNGSVAIDPVSGNPVYTPNPDFNGTDTFNYTVDDGNGGTDTATVTVTVGAVNDAPVAADDAVGTNEDTPVTVNVLPNDSDPDGDILSVLSVTQGANGSVAIDPVSGNPVYTPNPDFNGTDTFTYTVDDGNGGTDTATVTVTVGGMNDAPVAADDAVDTNEDTPVTVNVLPNDSDPDGDILSVLSVTQGANGSVAIDPVSGNPVYTPNPDFNGSDTFTYTVDDGNGGTDTATVTVTVGAVNDAPVATDDTIGTDEDTPVTVDVLPNDSDPDGDTLSVLSVTQGTNGSVAIDPVSGNPVYTPNPDFNGTDTFTYTVDDGNGGTDTATVTVTVGAVNDAPVAADDAIGTDEDTPVTVDVLPNDSDPDGDTLSVLSVTQGSNGSVAIDPVSGNPVYTPNADFNGTDTFTYTVDDGNGGTDTATVTVTVGAVNDAPVAADDAIGTDEDTPVTVDVLPNDSDPDGDTLSVLSVTQGSNGSVAIDPVSGNPVYTPNPDFNGTDTFTYTVDDGNGGTDTATVTVNVGAVNDAPVATDDSVGTDEDTPVTVDVLPNDSDPDGDTLSVLSVTQGTNGSVAIDPVSGNPVYTPNPDFNGTDTFTYTVDDGNGGTDTATVTVTVGAVNDAPLATDDSVGTDEDTPVTVDVLPNDSDPDGDTLSVLSVTQGTNGSVAIDPVSGNPVYTPNPDFNGTDTFTYTVDDGNGGVDTATVTVTVGAVNDAPVATDDTIGTDEDTPVTVDVLPNDSDPDGDTLSVLSVTQGTNGSVAIDPVSGNPVYTPNPDFNGTDTFTYTVDDGNGGTDTATVTVTVGAVNDAPLATDDSVGTDEDTPVTVDVLPNDSDPDGDSLSVLSVTQGSNGSVAIDPVSGNPVYTPNPDFNGTDTFTYTVDDGNGGTDTATVTVTVGAVNDAPVATDDSIGTDEDTPVTVDVLPNDSDPDGDTLSVLSVTQGTNGSVAIDPVSGNPVYTPNPDFNGTDTFTYTVDDGNGGVDTATVTVTVGAVNDAPVATDDTIGTDEDTPVTVDVLPNDSDPDGDTLSVLSVTQGTNGSVAIDPVSGNPVYTPNPDFNGTDTFTYTVDDGNGGTDTATVTVTVGAVNDAPIAAEDSIGTNEDTPVTIDVLPNDSDPDGDILSIASFTQGANGTVSIDPVSGNPVYTPNPDFNGTDTFTYTIDDGNGGTDTATVTVTVGAVNDAPVASDDAIGTDEDTPVTIDVLPNDSDPDGDTLSIASFTQGTNGSVAIDPVSGNPVYTPNADFNGTDTFTYTVDDGNGGTDTATVTVTVGAVNDAPVAADDAVGTDEDTPVTIDVLPNDSDPDGDTLSVLSVTQGTNGSVAIDPVSGNPVYTPNADFNGTDTFTYT